jgi:glycosyltransferase involved in cell wall biosynthesis
VHKSINLKLKIAEKLADKIFTASKESFQLKSKKIIITGHGIDVNKFKPQGLNLNKDSKLKIIYVSRISKIKNQEMLIRAIDVLVNKKNFKNLEVCIVGAPATPPDRPYLEFLKDLITKFNLNNYIKFIGKIPNKDIVKYYNESNLSVDLCPTGGVDKVVLESMACGVPVIVLNKTFVPILAAYQKELILKEDDPGELADKIFNFYFFDKSFMEKMKKELRDKIIKLFNLEEIIKKIITEL